MESFGNARREILSRHEDEESGERRAEETRSVETAKGYLNVIGAN
jgi:hypothetical protein